MNETTTQELPPEQPKCLLRARSGRVIGGVCAGLGRYFNADPIIFRIGAIVLAFVGGAGLLAYLAALLLIPSEDSPSAAEGAPRGRGARGRDARRRRRRGACHGGAGQYAQLAGTHP